MANQQWFLQQQETPAKVENIREGSCFTKYFNLPSGEHVNKLGICVPGAFYIILRTRKKNNILNKTGPTNALFPSDPKGYTVDFATSLTWIILAEKTVMVRYHVTQSSQ